MDKAGENEESTIKKKEGNKGMGRPNGDLDMVVFFILTWATPYWLLLGFSIVQVKQ
jgi:hypothetical protein